jgi:hypothetical protein
LASFRSLRRLSKVSVFTSSYVTRTSIATSSPGLRITEDSHPSPASSIRPEESHALRRSVPHPLVHPGKHTGFLLASFLE